MTKGELIEALEPFYDDIRIVVVAKNMVQQPIKAASYERADHHDEAVMALVIGKEQ